MSLPFSVEQFLGIFQEYNLAIWPMQFAAYILAAIALLLAIKKSKFSDRIITAVLAFFWLWMGIVYHLIFFQTINKAAIGFGILYVIQGLLFLYEGVAQSRLSFEFKINFNSMIGSLFIIDAMLIYPLIGASLGHAYPRLPSFGVAPCPTTIFTFGLLLWTDKKVPKYVLIIPFIWSLIGFSAAVSLGIREDVGLPVTGIVGTAMIMIRDRTIAQES